MGAIWQMVARLRESWAIFVEVLNGAIQVTRREKKRSASLFGISTLSKGTAALFLFGRQDGNQGRQGGLERGRSVRTAMDSGDKERIYILQDNSRCDTCTGSASKSNIWFG